MDVVTVILEELLQMVGEGIFPPPPPPPPPPPLGDGDGDMDIGYDSDSDATLPFEGEKLPFDWEEDKLWE